MRLSFKEMKDAIAEIVPKDINYDVDLEAGDIAIITPTPDSVSYTHLTLPTTSWG